MEYSSSQSKNDKPDEINEPQFASATGDITNNFATCESDNTLSKKRKLEESYNCLYSNETVEKLISNWISEYKIWYKITFGKDACLTDGMNDNIQNSTELDYKQNYSPPYYTDVLFAQPQEHPINYSPGFPVHLPNMSSYNHSKFTNKTKQKPPNMGYWGPLLRYGTYGVYKIYKRSSVSFKKSYPKSDEVVNNISTSRVGLSHPLDPPLRIRMPRQAMICTLQSKIKFRLCDLRKLETDPVLHMNINYSVHLEQVTKQCGTCPKYLYTKIENLPLTERDYFTFINRDVAPVTYLSLDGSISNQMKSSNDFYACELLIGDIIISQGFALWKRRAREICARNAFRVLERPCYLVGSIRYWYGTDYMTACTTEDPSVVPVLPPFLTDPTEPLYKKDEKINESNPDENFDILNPKSINDFWLYAPTLKPNENIKNIDPQIFLYQSAEFSQMNLSFEVETCWDESFTCTVMLDKSPAIKVEGLGNLEQACQAAALVLVDKLVDTQPIVVLKEVYHSLYSQLETNADCHDNSFLVRSLIWAQDEFNWPIDFKLLSDRINSETFLSVQQGQIVSSKDCISDPMDMEYLLNLYAQSSLVNPLKLDRSCVIDEVWSCVPEKVRKCGLIFLKETVDGVTNSILISKQVPHTQLKAMLLRDKSFGVFNLFSPGTLPSNYVANLNQYVCCEYLDYSSEADSLDKSKAECRSTSDVMGSTSFFKTSLYSDIINDIHMDLIPGLDF